jgi:hypothetical protein
LTRQLFSKVVLFACTLPLRCQTDWCALKSLWCQGEMTNGWSRSVSANVPQRSQYCNFLLELHA